MSHQIARRLLPSIVVAITVCWIFFNSPENCQKEANSDWCEEDARLVADIIEASDCFIAVPKMEKSRADNLIASYEAWHKFWLNDDIDNWEMTDADYKSMWKSFDDLNAAHTRFHTEIQRRIGNESFDGSEEIYEQIRTLQSANPLAVRKEKGDCAKKLGEGGRQRRELKSETFDRERKRTQLIDLELSPVPILFGTGLREL